MKKLLFFNLTILFIFISSIEIKSQGILNKDKDSIQTNSNGAQNNNSEIRLEIETPPNSRVLSAESIQTISNSSKTTHQLIFPSHMTKSKILIESPFGGKIIREINFEEIRSLHLKISEEVIKDPSNTPDPEKMNSLPELCPRMISKKNKLVPSLFSFKGPLLPEDAIYDGKLDFLNFPQLGGESSLFLESARLKFDYEDPTVLVGYNRQTGELAYEEKGGFYSNIHYFVFQYQPELETLYQLIEPNFIALRKLEQERLANLQDSSKQFEIEQEMKKHYDLLYGRENEIGPYQILMHTLFNSLSEIPKNNFQNLKPPLAHGFIPGPFRGSSHWGYSLCEWGDTFYQASDQTMNYSDYPLWKWSTASPNEKIILVVLEGDDQLHKNEDRIRLEQKGILRGFDYTDDLIGFFVIFRNETLNQDKILNSPMEDFILKVKTE